VTESDNGYWTFMTDKEYSLEEVAQIVESYRSEYFIPAKTVEISKGSKKAVTFFTEASGLDLCLECTSFPEESLTIGECEFTRID
jgi:lipocalin